jgi:hypothetical protein
MEKENVYEAEGYKIEVIKGSNDNVFVVYGMDGKKIEGMESIEELIKGKYIRKDKRKELSIMAEKVYSNELNELTELYHVHKDDNELFNKYFSKQNLLYKINGSEYTKEIKTKVKNEIKEMLTAEKENPYVYILGNKLNVMFSSNPIDNVKQFNKIYNDIINYDNFSLINKAIVLGKVIEKQFNLTIKTMDIIDKY